MTSEVETWGNPLFIRSSRGGRRSFNELLSRLEKGTLVVPDYQRGRVWTQEQKSSWVGSILSQGPLPAIFIREVDIPGGEMADQIVDGQQRLLAALDWVQGQIPAKLWNGEEVWCETSRHRAMLTRQAIPCEILPADTTDKEAMELYLLLNTSGTPHTQEELDKVRDRLKEVD